MNVMRIGVAPHRLWPLNGNDLEGVLETAVLAERLCFNHVIAGCHLLRTSLGVTLDPIVLLSAVAGATSRIRIATSAMITTLYHPVVLAHQAATLDLLSGGRFVFGVGTGWNRAEFDAVGAEFRRRGKCADESLAMVKALWRDEVPGMRLGVAPRTPGGPAVWVGGQSDAALRRVLRFGDAWHGQGDALAVAGIRRRLASLASRLGRDPATVELTSVAFLVPPGFRQLQELPGKPLGGVRPSVGSIKHELGLLEEAGVSACSLWLPVMPDALPDALAWTAEHLTDGRCARSGEAA
jgi:alkanesulfonate monooxygenase SsuD/methylene tetrahydromethanopterin reductase-like flavin-dependent oxidoreductase (luciferase family)